LAKETLANVNPSTLSAITGAATASDDLFLMYDTSALAMKKISRAELNNAITVEALDTVDINGGTIDGTAIGGTTPAAGAFTTLSASGSVTLSGGTANGVTYLNGSKVLTSGSALTFDGASNFSYGGSNATTYNTLNVNNTASNGYSRILFNIGASGANGIGSIKYAPGIFFAIGTDSDSSSTPIVFNLNNSEQMRLTSTGLGIGTSSPGVPLDVVSNGGANAIKIRARSGNDYGFLSYYSNDGATRWAEIYANSGSNLVFTTGNSGIERARIDSSGNLLVGTTSNPQTARLYVQAVGYNATAIRVASNGTVATSYLNESGSEVGYVQVNSSSTTYATSSDYRLKNTIAPMTGALAKVAQLKPVTYKWNADGSDGEGFIAHELAEVVPQAVTGEKDAVDADGNPVYQGIDTSFLVATLTAAIQEQQAIIESLKARLDAAGL
jgi:hypothetical protein